MSQTNRNGPPQQPKPLPDAAVEQLLRTQHQRALNEAEELKFKTKELEVNARLAEKSLDLQSQIISSRPSESRKTLTRLAYIVGAFTVIILGFLGGCLYLGKDAFAYSFLKGAGYIVTTGLGYWAGKKTNKKNSDNGVSDAEVVD